MLALCFGAGKPEVFAQVPIPRKVEKIEIQFVGPPSASISLVRSYLRVREGEIFTRANVDDDIRNLYATGLFRRIEVDQKVGKDGVILGYKIEGRPRLTAIKFLGNKKYSEGKLKKKLTSKVGEPLDERKLFNDAQELQKMYQKNGYHQTTVKAVPFIEEQTGRSSVTFEVKESPKMKIEAVDFTGAKALSEKKLKKKVKTRKRWFFSWITGSGRLKDDVLEEDKDRLTEFYQGEGYIDFDLKAVTVTNTTPKKVRVAFQYSEGKQYKVGNITFKGNAIITTSQLAAALKMKEGKTFNPKGLRTDLEALEDKYGEKGYVDARVVPLKRPNIEKGTMDLEYLIEEGEKAYIEKIEIRGNHKTKDKVIRRELAVAPGETFDMVKVKLSKKRLEGLNYFEKVDTEHEPTDVEHHKNLIVGVDEKSTAYFTLGAGFSSIAGVEGFVEFTQGNFDLLNWPRFDGGGQKLRVHATVGFLRQDYQVSFIEPWFMERKIALGVDLYHRALNYVSRNDYYNIRRTGLKLSLTRALGSEFLVGSVFYNVENVGIVDVDPNTPADFLSLLREEEGYRLVSKVGASLTYDTRDNALKPTKGHRTQLYSELAGGPFMGDTDYYRLEVRHVSYIKGFFEDHLWELTARTGTIEAYGNSDRVPLFDRYFLGGLVDLRGFDYRDIGPRRGTEPVGGNTFWSGSAEYYIPIVERVRFALFYDIGNVYASSWSFNRQQDNLRKQLPYYDDWGIGLRLDLPIGPLRFDLAFPVHKDAYTGENMKFQFSVGYVRDF
jgi:outer membrane protein insertion porin family